MTDDDVAELIYRNYFSGADNSIEFYGIWQLSDGEWNRIPINESDKEESERKAGEFGYIPIVVERINNTQLKITQPYSDVSEIIDVGYVAMDYVWPTKEDQEIHTRVRGENIVLGAFPYTEEMEICASVRIGAGELVGKMMYLDGQWVIEDFRLKIVE